MRALLVLHGVLGAVVVGLLTHHAVWSLRGRWPNVEVVEGDAREVELPREPFRVVANLPFHGTTEILRRLLDDPRVPLARADLVVEWGVAVKRGLPWPSSVNRVWSCGSVYGSSTTDPTKNGCNEQHPPGCGSYGSEFGIVQSYSTGSSASHEKTRCVEGDRKPTAPSCSAT